MKIIYSWLKEYIDLPDLTGPEEVVRLLTSMGVCTENIENKIINEKKDVVFDFEITPNRPDYLSVIGIARVLSSLLNVPLKFPDIKIKKSDKNIKTPVNAQINAKDACYRYTARVINNVKIGQSSKLVKERLEACGIRSINNVVDITNFVLLELGHPIHAFDYDKLDENKIIVRFANKDEKIITLDGISRKLDNNILVIADENKPIAVAGIIGGENTEVRENTKNILIESAYFVPAVVRHGSKILKLTTEASYRFERGADYGIVEIASNRVVQLINAESFQGGEISKIVDLKKKIIVPAKIDLRVERTNKILGVNLTYAKILNYLKKLYFKVKKTSKKDRLYVTVPTYRSEVTREIDLIEEIAQIYGLNRIDSKLPSITISPTNKEKFEIIEDNIKNFLINQGFYEAINYGFMDYKIIETLFADKSKDVVRIVNPLLDELNSMRTTLLFGLLENARHNINNGLTNIKLFEIGNVFALNSERKFLSIILMGLSNASVLGTSEKSWNTETKEVDFFELKGVIEMLLYMLNIGNYKLSRANNNKNLTIDISSKTIGSFGRIENSILKIFDIKEKVFFAEISLDDLIECCQAHPEFKGLQKYPSIKRDLAIIVKNNVELYSILEYIKSTGGEFLEDVELFDFYRGTQIPEDSKSLTFRFTFRSNKKTLTDLEVNVIHNNIIRVLKDNIQAVPRI